MEAIRSGTRVLVQRGHQGGRRVFTAMPSLRAWNSLVPPRPESGSLDGREQRLSDEGHVDEIVAYMMEVVDYYLPGVMALLHAEPEFEALRDSAGEVLNPDIGFLWISAEIGRSLGDGMHRGLANQRVLATEQGEDIAEDTVVVTFVVEPDRNKRRQLFNDINRTQKRVPKSLSISYDSRDPVSVAVNKIVETQPFGQLVEREKQTAGRSSGKLITAGTLYDSVRILLHGWSGRPGRRGNQPTPAEAKTAAETLVSALAGLPDIRDVLNSDDPGSAADALRARSILGSGATMKAIAGALYTARTRHDDPDLQEPIAALEKIDWEPGSDMWTECGFVPQGGRTPHSRSQEVRAAGIAIADVIAATT